MGVPRGRDVVAGAPAAVAAAAAATAAGRRGQHLGRSHTAAVQLQDGQQLPESDDDKGLRLRKPEPVVVPVGKHGLGAECARVAE